MNKNMSKNIWLDGMMGLVVGDALGCPVQFMTRDEIRNRPEGPVCGMESGGVYDMPQGTWTDDSSMAIATMASLIEKGEADPGDIMLRFIKYPDVNSCGATGEYANGNGALMRILPACLYYYDRQKMVCTSEDEAIHGIHQISGLTHNHIRSKMCCGIYYFCVKSIIDGVKRDAKAPLLTLLQEGIDKGLKYYGHDIRNLTEMSHLGRLFHLQEFMEVGQDRIKTSGYVIDSIEAAIWCLIHTSSYRECMLMAVNLGDDTDTVAAIAGGLAGLYYGYDGIPREWLAVIKKREWIEGMCETYADLSEIDTRVVDIHSHMLPAVDDGARDFEVTKQMLQLAYAEGTRHLFLTPHGAYLEGVEEPIADKMSKLREWIAAEQMELAIYPGAEIYVDPEEEEDTELILDKIKNGTYPTMNGTNYVLIEFYLGGFELEEVAPAVKAIIEAGYIPIIAHAERYGVSFDDLCYLRSLGCKLQMNICDLYRETENDINQMTHQLLREKLFDFIGTDAHGMDRRPPILREYIDFLYRNYDRDYVDGILYKNAMDCFGLK